ncbi:MAG TPA: diguanylate cyclase [Gallionella sp.]|nr:diguanylate cyclase [Gallionella sp.]
MKLRQKFFLLIFGILLGFSALAWFFSLHLLSQVNEKWTTMFAGRQVMFDKHRTLLPLTREIALARQMAADPALLDMALHEDDPAARARAIKVMETYRQNFRDQSYFVAFARSGHYYFNDADNRYAGRQLRYTLSSANPNDKWFYSTLKSGKDYQVNLDPDVHLGVTKVWINVLLKRGPEVLGVIGTGIDITDFLSETVDIHQPEVHNLFVDRDMAIQLYRDQELIDYASITKDVKQRSRVDALLSDPADIENLRQVMMRLENSGEAVSTLWVTFQGERHLLGVSWVPEIGWFALTLIDVHSLFFPEGLLLVPLAFGLVLLLALLLVGWLVHRWILAPIECLRTSMAEVEHGNYRIDLAAIGKGEISELSRQFTGMVKVVRDTRNELEGKVRQRTEELLRLTEVDQLTGLFNRRGMQERFDQEMARQKRQGGALGLLLLDLDHFKQINDRYGHAAGDVVLSASAAVILESIRAYDHAARWGGEEFLVLLAECDEDSLLRVAERIRSEIEKLEMVGGEGAIRCTTSIGAYYAPVPEEQDSMLRKADLALYQAKESGRNCVRYVAR